MRSCLKMSKEGTFEYQRDVYARMFIDLMVINRQKFNISSCELGILECMFLIKTYFNIKIDQRWLDILVDEYPDLFSFTKPDSSLKFRVDPIVAYEIEI